MSIVSASTNRAAVKNEAVQSRSLGEPVFVSQPLLPELEDLMPLLQQIWAKKYVTNHGPFHQRLETELRSYLGVDTAMLFCNGTIGLIAALKFFDLPPGSEVITSPLTFAATAHAISWNGLKPVFADVLPGTLTLDPAAAAQAITKNTSAIIGVHVYGTLCDVDAFAALGATHNLRIVYDAAHAFGTTNNGVPVGRYGDASVFSFHATKLFNTLEGGLIATPNAQDREKLYYLRNFGIKNEEEVVAVGINGKMNEVQSAIGLLNFYAMAGEKAKRRQLRKSYCDVLAGLDGVLTQPEQPGVENSEQYFPLIIDEKRFARTRDEVYQELKVRNVFARKYFHPICTDFEPYRHIPIVSARAIPHVTEVKSRVLCLPFHSGVSQDAVSVIADVFHGR